MRKFVLMSFAFLFAGCLITDSSTSPETGSSDSVMLATTSNVENECEFKCDDYPDYRVEIVKEIEFNLVNIINDNEVVCVIKTPSGVTKNGFGLSYAKRTKAGFSVSIEYGSRYHYEKQFDFVCKKNHFYLAKLTADTHDQNDPENTGRTFTKSITPNVPIENFMITDYMKE